MLKITTRQLHSLETDSRQRFVEEMVAHLFRFTPWHARSLRPRGLRPVIELGLRRALQHGLTQRGPVCLYLEVMFALGSDFDSDLQFPWAARLLGQEQLGEFQMDRAHELHLATNAYLEAVCGPEGQRTLATLRRAQAGGLSPVLDSFVALDRSLEELLWALSPEKSSQLGTEALQGLIHRGRALARTHGASTWDDEVLITLLMFGLGQGCLTDPQYPWIAAALAAPAPQGERGKFNRLRARALHLLGGAIRHLARRAARSSMRGARS